MSTCPSVHRVWMDFNLWGYTHCALPEGHETAHDDGNEDPWLDITAAHWKEMVATLSAIRGMHKAKRGEDDNGPYEICDYDKTPWPCRTHDIVAAATWL